MLIELRCERCACHFHCAEDTPTGEALERLTAEGPWVVLGDGETFEDRLYADLSSKGDLCCPRCRTPVSWNEEHLGRLAQQLLGHW